MFWHGSPKGSSAMQTVRGAGALAFGALPLAGAFGEAVFAAAVRPLAGAFFAAFAGLAGFLAAFLEDLEGLAGSMRTWRGMPDSTLKARPSPRRVPGRTFEQFTVGERLEHRRQLAVTMEDNVAFCRLTLNTQPLHLDEAAARKAGFPGVLVNGLLTFSACVGASVDDTTAGTLVANLGYQDVEHPEPVFPGDTLRFATEVLEKRPSSKPGRGIVTLQHRVHNQHGREVCRFKRIVMVRAGAP